MEIRKTETPSRELLLLADEVEASVADYIGRGTCYAACDDGRIVGQYVLIHTRPFTAPPAGQSSYKKARTQVQPLLVGLASLNTVSCPYAQAYIPSKAEAAGRDYKKMWKEPGPANKQ